MVESPFKGKQKHYVLTFIITFSTIMIRNIVCGLGLSIKKPPESSSEFGMQEGLKVEVK